MVSGNQLFKDGVVHIYLRKYFNELTDDPIKRESDSQRLLQIMLELFHLKSAWYCARHLICPGFLNLLYINGIHSSHLSLRTYLYPFLKLGYVHFLLNIEFNFSIKHAHSKWNNCMCQLSEYGHSSPYLHRLFTLFSTIPHFLYK